MSEEASAVPPKISPFGAASAAESATAPAASVAPTIRLKPVIRKPVIRKPITGGASPAAPVVAPVPAPAAKKSTQNLKSVTGPIPAQATLRKTGIISEGILTPEQAQAAKSRTSRISLESAIGAAPAKESPAPLKTIRLRRPGDLKPAPLKPVAPAASAPGAPKPAEPAAPAPVAAEAAPMEAPAAPESTTTQKRTLKLHRPGVSLKRPSLSGASAPAAAPAGDEGVADIADIPDLKPALNPVIADTSASAETVAGVPKALATASFAAGIAALLVLGAVMYFLYREGCSPDAGANAMAFLNI